MEINDPWEHVLKEEQVSNSSWKDTLVADRISAPERTIVTVYGYQNCCKDDDLLCDAADEKLKSFEMDESDQHGSRSYPDTNCDYGGSVLVCAP